MGRVFHVCVCVCVHITYQTRTIRLADRSGSHGHRVSDRPCERMHTHTHARRTNALQAHTPRTPNTTTVWAARHVGCVLYCCGVVLYHNIYTTVYCVVSHGRGAFTFSCANARGQCASVSALAIRFDDNNSRCLPATCMCSIVRSCVCVYLRFRPRARPKKKTYAA